MVSSEGSGANGDTIVVPAAGVAFYRVAIYAEDLDSFQFEKGTAARPYVKFGYQLADSVEVVANKTASAWENAKFTSYGDSITAQASWQPQIASAFSMTHTLLGVGGRRVGGPTGMAQQSEIDTIPTDTGLLLVLGGTNDWTQSRSLGTIFSTNTEELYGALNVMAERLTTRLPTTRIALLTTPYGELPGRLTDGSGWTTAHTNFQGLKTYDYAECARKVAKLWGFPVVDLEECGWNPVNLQTYMVDDGGWVHPNAAGGGRMAAVGIGRLGT